MNDRAREALVVAALSGVRQIKGFLRDDDGGRCALGVLCEAAKNDSSNIWAWADLQPGEIGQITDANDELGWDFLTISRKIGVPEYDDAVNPTQEDSK